LDVAYVASVCSKRFIYFRCTLHLGVAKVHLNVGVEEAQALGDCAVARAVCRLLVCCDGRP
jgi:hypothetical protein